MFAQPLGRILHFLSKDYFAALAHQLQSVDIDRHFYAIIVIDEATENISQKELAEKLQVDKVTAVKIIDYLADKKYVIRKVNTTDRRLHSLKLTEKAKKDLPVIKAAMEKMNSIVLKGLTKSEVQIFYKVVDNIQGQLADLPKDPIQFRFNRIKK